MGMCHVDRYDTGGWLLSCELDSAAFRADLPQGTLLLDLPIVRGLTRLCWLLSSEWPRFFRLTSRRTMALGLRVSVGVMIYLDIDGHSLRCALEGLAKWTRF